MQRVIRLNPPALPQPSRRAWEVLRVLAAGGGRHARSVAADRRARVLPEVPRGAVELRQSLQALGPTYVKLGQLLSTRADLLPEGYQRELAKLQTQVPPFPTDDVVATIEAELGQPISSAFFSFQREPLAAASIGQVHAATLHDGTSVVIKVRRPDVARLVEEDLQLVDRVAHLVSRLGGSTRRRIDPEGISHEFSRVLRRECDYLAEAAVADELRAEFTRSALPVSIPVVHHQLTTSGVLTMDRAEGFRIDDLTGLIAAGLHLPTVAETFANAFMSMVFTFGVFHGDPHPGNIFVHSSGDFTLIDFGKHGRIDPEIRSSLGLVVAGLVTNDAEALVTALEGLDVTDDIKDRAGLTNEMGVLLDLYRERPIGEMPIGEVLGDVVGVARRHRLRLPPDLLLLTTTVVMCEGVARQLDPNFVLQPVVTRWAISLFGTDLSRQPLPDPEEPSGEPPANL